MNPPISGQYMAVNIYEPGRTRARPEARSGVARDLLAR